MCMRGNVCELVVVMPVIHYTWRLLDFLDGRRLAGGRVLILLDAFWQAAESGEGEDKHGSMTMAYLGIDLA